VFTAGLAVALVAVVVFRSWRADAYPGDTNNDMTFVPITPCRVIDTRPLPDNVGGRSTLGAGSTMTVQPYEQRCVYSVIPPGLSLHAVALNVTAIDATKPTYLTIWQTGQPRPLASSLNPWPGEPPTPNKVDVGVGVGGFDVYNAFGEVDLVIDVIGFYTPISLMSLRSRVTALESAGVKPQAKSFYNGSALTNQVLDVEPVMTLDLPIPGPGTVIVNSNATVLEPDVGETVMCFLGHPDQALGGLQPSFSQVFVSTGSYGTLAGTIGSHEQGATKYQLKCQSSNGATVVYATMTATWTAD